MSVDGILLLDKPVGLTSNAALGRARRIIGMRKAGHTGTLDPLASGLLILCFGEATKVSGFLLDADKAYRAECRLGATTDTDDSEGQVVATAPVPRLDKHRLEGVLADFRGSIDQVPPMYSALKHKGRRLYELARAGQKVDRPARPVIIHELCLDELQDDRLALFIRCSKGTYIRSLVRDIGQALGCGAHLTALRRTASAPYRLADAITLDDLEGLNVDEARARLLPIDSALMQLPAVRLDAIESRRIGHGQEITVDGNAVTGSGLVRLYDNDRFIGIGEISPAGRLRPRRLLAQGAS